MAQAILVKYHGPTGTKGSRISATCAGGRVIIDRDYALNVSEDYANAAQALVNKMGWTANQGKGFEGVWSGGTLPNGDAAFVFGLSDNLGAMRFTV
tara:strand:+ start:237 stop:524 length:288 start_codon:yes stop_codon:yes gene_type:complete